MALKGRKQTPEHIAKRLASWQGHPRKLVDLETKLFKKIDKQSNGCWIWIGSIFNKGLKSYGQIRLGRKENSKCQRAHRVTYEHFIGKIPDGLELDHLCKNTLCVNPKHLEPVTHAENMKRGYWNNKTRCIHGHEYKNNTYINVRGHRECKICRKLRISNFYKKN